MKKHPKFAPKTPPFWAIFALVFALFAPPLAAKTAINLVKLGSVPAMDEAINTSQVVPNGKTVYLKRLGGLAPAVSGAVWSYVVLQWGSGSAWTTIRAGYGTFDFSIGRDFVGDGTSRFRLIRRNKSAKTALEIGAWFEALVKD